MRAIWNNKVIAESDATVTVESNVYFPPDAVRKEFLRASSKHTLCPWKGRADYCDVVVDGETNHDAAWYYPEPRDAAAGIRGYVAFWHGVSVSDR